MSSRIIVLADRNYELIPLGIADPYGIHVMMKAKETAAEAGWDDVEWFKKHVDELPGNLDAPLVFAGAKHEKLITSVMVKGWIGYHYFAWWYVGDHNKWRKDVLLVKRVK